MRLYENWHRSHVKCEQRLSQGETGFQMHVGPFQQKSGSFFALQMPQ